MKTKTMKAGISISSLALLLLLVGNTFGQQIDPTALYRITAKHSGKCLAVAGGNTAVENSVGVIQWDCINTEDNQKWRIISVGLGLYEIVAFHSGKSLDVRGGVNARENGVPVQQYDYVGGANQKWRLIALGDGFYRIVASHSGKSLDINGGPGATGNGPQAQQWEWVNGDNQKFRLVSESVVAAEVKDRFRVTLTGFLVNHETVESILSIDGAGDEVFAMANFAEIWSSNNIFGALQRKQSLVYGDTNGRSGPVDSIRIWPEREHQSTTIFAGSMSRTGGLKTRDRFPPPEGPLPSIPTGLRDRAIPMVLWEGELRKGGLHPNVVALIPTIWENDNNPAVLDVWNRQVDDFLRRLAANGSRLVYGPANRPLVEQVDTVLNTIPQTNDFDRPIGMDGDAFNPGAASPNPATFIPAVMLLTYGSAVNAANANAQGAGLVEITYRDGEHYGQGSYTIFLRVERLS
jgi:hypothetical protein